MAFFDKLGDFAGGFVQGAAQSMPAYMETQRREERRDVELAENRRRQDSQFFYQQAMQFESPDSLQQLYALDEDYANLAANNLGSKHQLRLEGVNREMDSNMKLFNNLMLTNPWGQTVEDVVRMRERFSSMNGLLDQSNKYYNQLGQIGEMSGQDFLSNATQAQYTREELEEVTALLNQRAKDITSADITEAQARERIATAKAIGDHDELRSAMESLMIVTEGGELYNGKPVPFGLYNKQQMDTQLNSLDRAIKFKGILDIADFDAYQAYAIIEKNPEQYPPHLRSQIEARLKLQERGDIASQIEGMQSRGNWSGVFRLLTQDADNLGPEVTRRRFYLIDEALRNEASKRDDDHQNLKHVFNTSVSLILDRQPTPAYIDTEGDLTRKPSPIVTSEQQARLQVMAEWARNGTDKQRQYVERETLLRMGRGNIPDAIANKIINDITSKENELGINLTERMKAGQEGLPADVAPELETPLYQDPDRPLSLDPEEGEGTQQIVDIIEAWQDKIRESDGMSIQEKQESLAILEAVYGTKYGIQAGNAWAEYFNPLEQSDIQFETFMGPKMIGEYLREDMPWQSSRMQRQYLAEYITEGYLPFQGAYEKGAPKEKNKIIAAMKRELRISIKNGLIPINTNVEEVMADVKSSMDNPDKRITAKASEIGREVDSADPSALDDVLGTDEVFDDDAEVAEAGEVRGAESRTEGVDPAIVGQLPFVPDTRGGGSILDDARRIRGGARRAGRWVKEGVATPGRGLFEPDYDEQRNR